MSTAFWLIVTATIQVTLLCCAALLVNRFCLRNQPKEAARLLAFSSLLMLALTLAIALPLPSWFSVLDSANQTVADAEVVSSQQREPIAESPAASDPIESSAFPTRLPALTVMERVQSFSRDLETGAAANSHANVKFAVKAVRWTGILIAVLFLLAIVRFVISLIAIKRLQSGSKRVTSLSTIQLAESLCQSIGCKRKIQIHHSNKLATAATVGAFRPHIFLASDFEQWQPADQKAVLAHEIAHIHHRDFEANIICQICRVIHFFNPAVQWLTRQMQLQQELAADRVAAQLTCGAIEYSRTLASLAIRQDEMTSPIASMFLPRKNDFIQRIKMLRNETAHRKTPTGLITVLTIAIAVATCGIRLPASALGSPGLNSFVDDKEDAFDLSWVGAEGAVMGMRPNALLKSPLFKNLSRYFSLFAEIGKDQEGIFEETTGLGSEHVSETIVYSPSITSSRTSFQIYRTFEDNLENFKSLGKIVGQDKRFPILIERSQRPQYGLILDEKSILWTNTEEGINKAREIGDRKPKRAVWFEDFKKVQSKQIVGAISGTDFAKAAVSDFEQMLDKKVADAFCKCTTAVLSIDLTAEGELGLVLNFSNVGDAKAIEDLAPEIRKMFSNWFQRFAQSPHKREQILGESALESVKNAKVKRVGRRVELSATFSPDLTAIENMADEIKAADVRIEGMNNMRQLNLAMLNYESAHGALPSATMRSESGHEYSWRIAILPYLERNDLYEKYRFDEPWDSEHNQAVTSEMPKFFKHPASESPTDTNFFAVVGPGTLFPPEGKITFDDAQDGSERTVLLVEAIRDSHWAKPGGIPLEEALVPEALGGFTKGVIHVSMFNGSIRSVSDKVTPEMLAALYSVAGGDDDVVLSEVALELETEQK